MIDCVSKVNTGGKFNDEVFQFSVGLNGIGTKAVNALSSDFEVDSFREGKVISEFMALCAAVILDSASLPYSSPAV